MTMLMAFLPFIAFAVLAKHLGLFTALLVAALISVYPLARSWRASRRVLALECVAFAVFTLLALWSIVSGKTVSLFAVRLAGDAAFTLVALGSLLLRRPFTLQYQQPRPQGPLSPLARRIHNQITGVWALAFAVMTAVDGVMLTQPALSTAFGVGVTIAALAAAIKFTQWYPGHARQQQI